MGQYYLIVNLDKKQYIYPHRFGDGLKLLEFGPSPCGTMCGLALLLSNGNGRGGGDLRDADDSTVVGSWAGDRIVVAGDYGDEGKWLENVPVEELAVVAQNTFTEGYQVPEHVNLYAYANAKFRDVSDEIIREMLKDQYLREELQKTAEDHRNCWASKDGPLAAALKELLAA